ncbi:uncharacterized protein [Pyrus communis]|uniref:uncharacterized protein n=1 Tax=Pyrus communis TaxID=23211 RepID=UPI0035C1AF0A
MDSSYIPINDKYIDYLLVTFEDSLDLEERIIESVHLVSLLITNVEPSQLIVKDILRSLWRKMGNIKVSRAKPNVYFIQVGDEKMARRILEGNPWFIKGAPFTVTFWPHYQSLDAISGNCAIFWVQVHGILRNNCTVKNARMLGAKIDSVLEVEDPTVNGFCGFLRIRVDLNTTRPLLTNFTMPCPTNGSRTFRLKYEELKDFCYNCGQLNHVPNCRWKALISKDGENRYNSEL